MAALYCRSFTIAQGFHNSRFSQEVLKKSVLDGLPDNPTLTVRSSGHFPDRHITLAVHHQHPATAINTVRQVELPESCPFFTLFRQPLPVLVIFHNRIVTVAIANKESPARTWRHRPLGAMQDMDSALLVSCDIWHLPHSIPLTSGSGQAGSRTCPGAALIALDRAHRPATGFGHCPVQACEPNILCW